MTGMQRGLMHVEVAHPLCPALSGLVGVKPTLGDSSPGEHKAGGD